MTKDSRKAFLKKCLSILWVIYVLGNIAVWLPQVDQLFCREFSSVSQYTRMDDGWDIAINDTVYTNANLNELNFEAVKKGDHIVMQRKLPEDWNVEQGTLRLNIRHTATKMYIDGNLVYEYGYDRMRKNKTVGSGYQFVNFPDSYKGKQIRIESDISEDKAFSRFDSMRIYEWKNAYRALVTENRIPLFLGCFLAIFGLAILMITSIAILFSKKYFRMFCIALFSICMGLWTLCYYNVMLVFSIPLYSVTLLEYMTLYLAPLPITIYMYENVKNLKNKFLKFLFWVLLAVEIGFDAVVLTLHAKDIVHCAAALKYMQIMLLIGILYFIVILLMNMRASRLTSRMYLVGMLIIFCCAGYDLLNYYSERYYAQPLTSLKGLTAIGVMIFVFILITSFYINMAQKMMQEKERAILIKRAYTDELTQLHNRRYCADYMKEMEDGSSDYTIFCFDLNNLKTVNDTYGHAKGDLLIKSAADVIAKTFDQYGVVGRMGGDEFIALLPLSQEEEIKRLQQEFGENIAEMNRRDAELGLSIAYGYAVSTEIKEKHTEKVFQMADDRMYHNKKAYKEQMAKSRAQA